MAPPLTPVTKRPALGWKRDSSYLDTDDEAGLSTSTKRLRVAFDDNVDVRIMEDWTDKSYELVKEEVRIGIQQHLAPVEQRNDAKYIKLLQLLEQDASSSEAPSTKLLKKYVTVLDMRASLLGDCGKLVNAVLDLSWLGRDEGFVASYTKFLRVLASTHAKFIAPMMERLVSHFQKLPASRGRLPGEDPVLRATMFDRLHATIKAVLKQTPSASAPLARMLKLQFPNDLATAKAHLQYQKHLLRMADDIPEMKDEIVALIMQRLVGVDIQIQQDIEELEDDMEAKLLQRDNTGDADESDDSDIESLSESEITGTEEQEQLRELKLKVAKLDCTQDLLFEYYKPLIPPDSIPEESEPYNQLLLHFNSFIMPNRSRHAQFLLFHFSQTSPEYVEAFIKHCQNILEANGTIIHRLTACAYLASFVARGSHIPPASVCYVVEVLCQFLEDMRRRYEPNCMGPDRRSYSLYYAVAQALFYIFCFRWRDLVIRSATPGLDGNLDEEDFLVEGNDLVWMPGMKEVLTKNVNSVLNPLKVCSAAIVSEFAQIANHLRFIYIFSLLERNKRVRLGQKYSYYQVGGMLDIGRREGAWDRKVGDAHHQLEAYFPFDPYHLPKSKKWIETEYIEWKLPKGMNQEIAEELSESEDEYSSDEDSVLDDLPNEQMAAIDTVSVGS